MGVVTNVLVRRLRVGLGGGNRSKFEDTVNALSRILRDLVSQPLLKSHQMYLVATPPTTPFIHILLPLLLTPASSSNSTQWSIEWPLFLSL